VGEKTVETGCGINDGRKELQERSSPREARELKFAQNSIDEYGIPWVEM